jgi:hypothetical protein
MSLKEYKETQISREIEYKIEKEENTKLEDNTWSF